MDWADEKNQGENEKMAGDNEMLRADWAVGASCSKEPYVPYVQCGGVLNYYSTAVSDGLRTLQYLPCLPPR